MKFSYAFLLLFSTILLPAQVNLQVKGKIIDTAGTGIDLAQGSLINPVDSSFVKSEFTDQDGTFLLSNLSVGEYFLQVNLLGYEEYREMIDLNTTAATINLPAIILTEDTKILEEVTVTAKVPFIERKIDRYVVNPEALISNAGTNALELLEKAPGVSLDNNGSILLKGRTGVTIFINDKPSYLSGAELENYLRSLPTGSIKQIEIIENPPAKYEAAGNSGVINIIIKRSTLKGFHGNTALSYRRSRYNGSNNSLNLNYNKNKISLFANIYAGFYGSFQDLNINRFYKDENDTALSSFKQNSFNTRNGKYLNATTGLDFYPTDATSLGVSYKNANSPTERRVDNTAIVSDAQDVELQRIVADNLSNISFKNALYNFYINHKIDTSGSKISLDADFVQYTSGNDQNFKNFVYNPDDILTYDDLIEGEIPSTIKIYAAKTDYTKPLNGNTKLEAGLKTAFTKTDNEAIYTNTVDGTTSPDYNLSNRFLYDEWINAAYLNLNRSFGRFDLQAGLRAESTKLTGEQLGNVERPDTTFTRTYNSLFPTFYASVKLDSAQVNSLTFSYGRRINRPYFQDLNPFISPLDRFTFYSGNPDLLPTFSHNLSLSHSYKGILNTSLSFAKTIDGINETLEIRDEIYYSRPGNIDSNTSINLSINGNFKVNKWYNINSYIELGYLKFDSELYTENLNSSGFYQYASLTNSFQLGKGWKADVSGQYRSDIVSAQLLIKSFWVANFGVQKKIMDGKGNLKLSVNDIFYSRRGNGIINNLRLTDADWDSKYDSQNVALAFFYNFGNSNSKKQKYNSSGSDSEQGRVRG